MHENKNILKEPLPFTNGHEWPMKAPVEIDFPQLPQGQTWPKISIVTPSLNQGPYLEKTIRSVLLQGYPNLEYIIMDGGSTDQSIDVINKYEPWIDFWVSEKDEGQSHAINKGLSKASGELLGWLNSDDWFTEGALFKLAEAYLEDTSVGVIYGQGHIVDEQGSITYTPEHRPADRSSLMDWACGGNFMQPSCLFARKAWLDHGPLDQSLHFCMDADLWLKISEDYQFKKIDDLLSLSLTHVNAKTTAYRNAMFTDLAVVLIRHGGEEQARKILNQFVRRLNQAESYLSFSDKHPYFMRLLGVLKGN